jgi:pachytene checkpoint protein 2
MQSVSINGNNLHGPLSHSCLYECVDSAFVDRADIKQYIGLPPPEAIYWILCGCLTELMRARIVQQLVSDTSAAQRLWQDLAKPASLLRQTLLDWKQVAMVRHADAGDPARERIRQASLRMAQLAESCQVS